MAYRTTPGTGHRALLRALAYCRAGSRGTAGRGEAEHQTQALRASQVWRLRTHVPLRPVMKTAGKCCPPAQGLLLEAGHTRTLRLALSKMPRPPEGWGAQCGPHCCTNSLGPASYTHQLGRAPSGHPNAQIPPGRAELSRGLEAEPDLAPALASPALHRRVVGADRMWGCCWIWGWPVAGRAAPVRLAVTRRPCLCGHHGPPCLSSPLIGSCLSHVGQEGAPPFPKLLGKGRPALSPPGPPAPAVHRAQLG